MIDEQNMYFESIENMTEDDFLTLRKKLFYMLQ